MIPLEQCFRYEPKITRLTKANSFTHQGKVIYVVKKESNGKAYGIYIAYDYKTKVQLGFNRDKNWLIEFIKKQDLGILDELDR